MRGDPIPPSFEANEGLTADDPFNRLGIEYCEQLVGPVAVFEEDVELEHHIVVENAAGATRSMIYEAWDVDEARVDMLATAVRETGDDTWRTVDITSSPYDSSWEDDEDEEDSAD